MHDWGYSTEPEAAMGGRRVEFARGKVVGGSSSTNAMAYVRGHRGDYDRWAAQYGLPHWSYAHVLPYFRRQESWEGGPDPWRGGDGQLTTRFGRYPDPIGEACLEAGREAGHPFTEDFNGERQEGFARWQMTVRDGRRCSAADAYLRPALARRDGRVRIEVRALATSVLFEGQRAVGVEYLKDGKRSVARAEREVILAGGVVNSPQLLMLSGIGDPEMLSAHGIAVRVPLRGVGRNLQDHISAAVAYRRREPGPLHARMRRGPPAARSRARLAPRHRDRQRVHGAGHGVSAQRARRRALPDIQFLVVAAPMTAGPYLAPFVPPYPDGFAIRVAVLRPESRGNLALASADPRTPPRIVQNFLAAERDRVTLRAGLRMAREVGRQAPLRPFVAEEAAPGPENWSDAALDAHIAATGISVHHPLGTCRMGARSGGGRRGRWRAPRASASSGCAWSMPR